MKVVTFKIDEDTLEELETYARLKGMTRSEAIRQAIKYWLSAMRKDYEKRIEPKIIKILS